MCRPPECHAPGRAARYNLLLHAQAPDGSTMAKATNKTEASLDKPLFSLSYDLSAQLTDEAARLLAGDKTRNPASVTSYALLVLIVIAALAPATKGNVPLLVGMVVVEVILWGLADRWPQVQLRKLRHAGLDTALIPADKRRRTVAVYEDTLTVTSPDAAETLRIADLRGATLGNEMAVLAFANGSYVLVPSRAMSAQRYRDLLKHVGAVKETAKK